MSEHSMTLSWNDQASENTKRVRGNRLAVCSCGEFRQYGPVGVVQRKAVAHLERARRLVGL
jgi:hypothetical protein